MYLCRLLSFDVKCTRNCLRNVYVHGSWDFSLMVRVKSHKWRSQSIICWIFFLTNNLLKILAMHAPCGASNISCWSCITILLKKKKKTKTKQNCIAPIYNFSFRNSNEFPLMETNLSKSFLLIKKKKKSFLLLFWDVVALNYWLPKFCSNKFLFSSTKN